MEDILKMSASKKLFDNLRHWTQCSGCFPWGGKALVYVPNLNLHSHTKSVLALTSRTLIHPPGPPKTCNLDLSNCIKYCYILEWNPVVYLPVDNTQKHLLSGGGGRGGGGTPGVSWGWSRQVGESFFWLEYFNQKPHWTPLGDNTVVRCRRTLSHCFPTNSDDKKKSGFYTWS
jgi:hypothetical protein